MKLVWMKRKFSYGDNATKNDDENDDGNNDNVKKKKNKNKNLRNNKAYHYDRK